MGHRWHQIPAGAVPREVNSDSGILFPSSRRDPRSCSLCSKTQIFQGFSVSREQKATNPGGSGPQARQGQAMAWAAGASSLAHNHNKALDKLLLCLGLIHPRYDGADRNRTLLALAQPLPPSQPGREWRPLIGAIREQRGGEETSAVPFTLTETSVSLWTLPSGPY